MSIYKQTSLVPRFICMVFLCGKAFETKGSNDLFLKMGRSPKILHIYFSAN